MLARFALLFALVVCAPAFAQPITTVTADGVTLYGEPYFADLDDSAPLVLLFHQAGTNGRGEYAPLAAWLNEAGFRAIAWDQRSGGSVFGSANRTVAGLADEVSTAYCDAYPDLEAALAYVTAQDLADRAYVWGSSYSAALVFRLAAEHPEAVAGVLSFSPAAGGPMVTCRARQWIDEVKAPAVVFRPASEMNTATSAEQRDLLVAAGTEFHVIERGVHGSSMLVDERTQRDMSEARATVLAWLNASASAGK